MADSGAFCFTSDSWGDVFPEADCAGMALSVAIEMENDIPILGVEFILNNIAAKSLETTSRTEGFVAVFNDLGGQRVKVVLVSLKKDAISAGSGPILEFVHDGTASGDQELTDVNIADADNQPVAANLVGADL